MKATYLLLAWLLFSHSVFAETTKKKEIPSKEDQQKIKEAASNVAEETKKALRKIGKRSEEEACRFTSTDPKKCKIQKPKK